MPVFSLRFTHTRLAGDKNDNGSLTMTNKKSETHSTSSAVDTTVSLEDPSNTQIKRKMRGYPNMFASAVVLLTMGLCLVNSSAASEPVVLTKNNFDQVTAGKTVFIKFHVPWCGHCQELLPEWKKFAAEWVDHPQLLVAEVDCMNDEKWCQTELNIEGFPTLLYGDPSNLGAYLERYDDERTYKVISKFANKTLTEPFCSPGNLDACDSKLKEEMKGYLKMSESNLEKEIQKKENAMDDAVKKFKIIFDMMQAKYDKTAAAHESASAKLKTNIKMLRAVKEATKWRSNL